MPCWGCPSQCNFIARVKVFGNLASLVLAVCKATEPLGWGKSTGAEVIFGGCERRSLKFGLQVAFRMRSGRRALLISCGY
jgi:hypothetical protein